LSVDLLEETVNLDDSGQAVILLNFPRLGLGAFSSSEISCIGSTLYEFRSVTCPISQFDRNPNRKCCTSYKKKNIRLKNALIKKQKCDVLNKIFTLIRKM
jgi:hypothetical protein